MRINVAPLRIRSRWRANTIRSSATCFIDLRVGLAEARPRCLGLSLSRLLPSGWLSFGLRDPGLRT